jgi:hypothetical protein
MMRPTLTHPAKRRVTSWKLLAEASAILDSSFDYEATLRHVAGLTVPTVADICSIMLVDERGNPQYTAG